MTMLSVEEAQARVLALVAPLQPETASLEEASGRWLAESLIAERNQPWTDLSAMDGYAIRHTDLPGPWALVGESAAGGVPGAAVLQAGEALRIFTGAPLPPGADTVIVQEDVTAEGGRIRMTGEGPDSIGKHVRPLASDFAEGDELLPAGARLGPAQIGLAALAGRAELPVRRRPRVAILSTGSELVPPGAPCPPGKLPASNGAMLRAMVSNAGGLVFSEQLVPDDLGLLSRALKDASEADIIVTSGGASVGDHDLVRPALEAAGGFIDFWRIAMRPGKPLIVGRLGNAVVIGLPGNPVSAMVTGSLFLLPLVRHLAGAADALPSSRVAELGSSLPAVGGRTEFVRGMLARGVVIPLQCQDSAGMRAAASANALIVRPARAPAAAPGEAVTVFEWAELGLLG